MNDPALSLSISEQDYLAGEQVSEVKHELINGQIYAMTGATDDHNRISGNIYAELRQQLKGSPCEAFIADMMLHVGKNYFYPDVMVICKASEHDTALIKHAPTVVIEVLSPSTRKTDVTSKKVNYLNLPSLQEYILVEQDKCEIEVFRKSQSWASTYYVLGDTIILGSIDVEISVEDIYERVQNDDMTSYRAQKKQ